MKAVGTKDEGKPEVGQASSDIPALKPYWGKPAVRNFRGGDGNVGIIRSPVRAIALPDFFTEVLDCFEFQQAQVLAFFPMFVRFLSDVDRRPIRNDVRALQQATCIGLARLTIRTEALRF